MTNAVNIAGLGAALTVSGNVVNFSSTPTVSGSPIGASAATPTALGTVYGETESTGANTTALGYQAFNASSTGTLNTAVGWQALTANTSGNNNTAVGEGALTANTTGSDNVSVGLRSMYTNTTGGSNTALGRNAMRSNTTSTGNVAVGFGAGYALTTGSYNILIGYETATSGKTGGVDCIYIGRTITANNTNANGELVINTNGNNVTGKGDGTGLIATGGSIYQQNNSSSWATTSDFRLKKNIVDNTEGLDVISQIRVRNFEYRTEKEITELPTHAAIQKTGVQLGVIAQELQEVCPDCIKEESTGVLSVDSDNIFWHMVNAIKDLKAELDTVKAELAALKG